MEAHCHLTVERRLYIRETNHRGALKVALTVLLDGMTSKQAARLSHGKADRTWKLKKADYVNKYQMRVRAVISDHDLDQPQGFVALTTAEALPQLFVLLLHLTNSLTGTTIVLHRIWTARL